MPEGAVYVGRPTKWGNPLRSSAYAVIAHCLDDYRKYVNGELQIAGHYFGYIASETFKAQVRNHLRGKDLACWCPLDKPCHADVLLEIANEGS